MSIEHLIDTFDSELPNFNTLSFSEPRPDFITQDTIEEHAERIRLEVAPFIFSGISKFVKAHNLEKKCDLSDPLQQQAWMWAVKSSKYNAAYFFSRGEARQDIGFVETNSQLIDEVGSIIDNLGGVASIGNYALHSYVEGYSKLPNRKLLTAKKSTPQYAIQGSGYNEITVKSSHFLDTASEDCFDNNQEIHDWHDLAHVLAASSSYGKFGVKYNDGLNDLDRYYRSLTEGEGMMDASGPLFSDGLLFTQLSRPLFEYYENQKNADGSNKYDNDEIKNYISVALFLYLKGGSPLFHPVLGRTIEADRSMNPLELAVCEQNKRYERRAAEVELELLVRGTPEGSRGDPDSDPLLYLSRSERIKRVAGLEDRLLYFEARNLIRHRAHEDALGQYANFSLQTKRDELQKAMGDKRRILISEVKLLQEIVDFYQMNDLRLGYEINLYREVEDYIAINS